MYRGSIYKKFLGKNLSFILTPGRRVNICWFLTPADFLFDKTEVEVGKGRKDTDEMRLSDKKKEFFPGARHFVSINRAKDSALSYTVGIN